jgi:ATP-dependent RNA helicase DDX54/DBP10
MPHRAASPATSENDFDISNALFGPEEDSESEDGVSKALKSVPKELDAAQILNLAEKDDEDEDGGDEAFIAAKQAASNRKSSNIKGRSVKKGGGFQAMGLSATLLKAITRKGFSVPTPIQRKTIPLLLDDADVVGMARTGSGKTAAFVIPMIEKLKGHSTKVGSRALILSPSRELALQTLKVVKELGRGTDLRCVLLVGGDSLEEQFASMAGNPDIIIATPGRFLHLKVEMGLDLSSVRYVVFDEADRLFEMGFAAQLAEILHALPASRQTLLFSATLPKSLVEFAKAGLQDPTLIRLDAESKVSPDLQSAFFTIKSADKEGALLHILHDVIKIPTGLTEAALKAKKKEDNPSKKRKRSDGEGYVDPKEAPSKHSTIVFAATKHHVDYIASLLRLSGFAVSYVYGSLDQTARKEQVQDFRTGMTHILVVTDVAARGIDIPILANVINYDFPSQPKIFVHRVGRTARAGQKGWSYSLVRDSDAPYLLDLQLFLGKRLLLGRGGEDPNYAEDVTVGTLAQDPLERSLEWVVKILDEDSDLSGLRSVAMKGEKLYMRTRNSASIESAKRAKDVVASESWSLLHSLFDDDVVSQMQLERDNMLAKIGGFRPQESIFEIGKRGKNQEEAVDAMRKVRRTFEAKKGKRLQSEQEQPDSGGNTVPPDSQLELPDEAADFDMSSASESELEVTFSEPHSKKKQKGSSDWQDPENFMSYIPANHNFQEDRAYGVQSGSNTNFTEDARGVTMDLGQEEGKGIGESRGIMRWDKRQKKYVARRNDEDGSKKGSTNLVRGESGRKVAASFRSGRFDAWKKSNRIGKLPRVGEKESTSARGQIQSGKRYRHRQEKAPKEADKYREDYDSRKKRVDAAKEKRIGQSQEGKRQGGKEIKGVDDIRKARNLKQKRQEKNARPVRRK